MLTGTAQLADGREFAMRNLQKTGNPSYLGVTSSEVRVWLFECGAAIPAGLDDHLTSHDVRRAFGAELAEAASTS
jgi:hypothetical protein